MTSLPEAGPSPVSRLRTVLFDLDDTLFDHAHATRQALAGLRDVEPALTAWPLDELLARHDEILETLHLRVLAGELTIAVARIERFRRLLEAAAAPDARHGPKDLASAYRRGYEVSWRTVPGAEALLGAVKAAGLRTVVVTNNGVAEQRLKLSRCGLTDAVDELVTSEEVGVSKPDAEIFEVALDRAHAGPSEAVMLGDAWPSDVEGARAAGIRPVWFNRKGLPSPDPTVQELASLEPTDEVFRLVVEPPTVAA